MMFTAKTEMMFTAKNEKAEKEAKMRQLEAEKAERDRISALHEELINDKQYFKDLWKEYTYEQSD